MRILLLVALALLLAGCTDGAQQSPEPTTTLPPGTTTPGGSSPAPGVAPQQGYQENSTMDLHFGGTMRACEAGYCLWLNASNEGSKTYYVNDGRGGPAITESMEKDGERVHHTEPRFYPAVFSVKPFSPQEKMPYEATWNGTLWDDETQRYIPAPNGAYQWDVLFVAFGESDGADRTELKLRFTVVIGET